MNFSFFLLEYLKKQASVSLSGFGTFYLHTMNAVLDQEGKNISPPGAEVAFKPESSGDEIRFIQFLAKENKSAEIEAEIEIKKQINYWNATLYKDKKVVIDQLGTFFLEDSKMVFVGNRTENLSPAFYGLEEINISEIKNSTKRNGNSYQTSKSLIWISTLVIGVLGITYLGITQPEMIFGKRSFKDELPKKEIISIKKDSLKSDSLRAIQLQIDSLKNDSLQNTIALVKTPNNKWSSKNYSKSKWKKPKKHQSH